jgi:DNA topoisomerase-6 subunit A
VRAENAGSVVGPLVLGDDGDRVDCARLGKGGYSVPSIIEPEYIEIRRCTADFVLLVEKGTQWNRLAGPLSPARSLTQWTRSRTAGR